MKNSNKQIILTEIIFFSGLILAYINQSIVIFWIGLAIAYIKSISIDRKAKKKEEAEKLT